MVGQERNNVQKGKHRMKKGQKMPKRDKWRYFYYGGKLHKRLAVDRASDEVLTWCYSEHCKKVYSWSAVKRSAERALTYADVGELLGRSPRTIRNWVYAGYTNLPEQTYSLETGKRGMYLFSKEHVYSLWDVMRRVHRGRPRSDGMITTWNLPSKDVLRSAMDNDVIFYAINSDGEYVPIWKAEEW